MWCFKCVSLPLVEQEPGKLGRSRLQEKFSNCLVSWPEEAQKYEKCCVNVGCVARKGAWMERNPVSSYFLFSPVWSAPGLCSCFVRLSLVQVLGTFRDVQTQSSNLLLGFKVSVFGHISYMVCS